MTISDPISDLLTRIRNAQMRRHERVDCLDSKVGRHILDVMKNEGFIKDYKEEEIRKGIKKLVVELRYHEEAGAIKKMRRISKPGCRVYTPISELKKVCNGLGVAVLSTSKGVISDAEARKINVGGEVLFEIY